MYVCIEILLCGCNCYGPSKQFYYDICVTLNTGIKSSIVLQIFFITFWLSIFVP